MWLHDKNFLFLFYNCHYYNYFIILCIFYEYKFGSFFNRSTTHAIFHLINEIVSGLDIGHFVAGVFLDLTRLCDLVDHTIIFQKLHRIGVRGVPAQWIHFHISER